MIGSELAAFFPKEAATIGAPVLEARGLSGAGFVEEVSFALHAGEILGFFGLVGAGRSEVAEMLFGITRPDSRRDPRRRPHGPAGLAARCAAARHLAPARGPPPAGTGAASFRSARTRLCRCCAGSRTGSGSSIAAAEAKIAGEFASRMRVVATGIEQLTNTLSGGNQQKVLLAKWLIPEPRVLILDQPTRGIDVGAKAEIHRIISQLASQGIAIILISDDAAEVIAMADRIVVFRGGRMVCRVRARRRSIRKR